MFLNLIYTGNISDNIYIYVTSLSTVKLFNKFIETRTLKVI